MSISNVSHISQCKEIKGEEVRVSGIIGASTGHIADSLLISLRVQHFDAINLVLSSTTTAGVVSPAHSNLA